MSRRDPSPVVRAGGRYHAWYSRSTHDASGYRATIWHATSADGLRWEERGEALGRGRRGAFDEHAVFTPTVMLAEGRWWLFYTAVPEPFDNAGGGPAGTGTRIGVASATAPRRAVGAGGRRSDPGAEHRRGALRQPPGRRRLPGALAW